MLYYNSYSHLSILNSANLIHFEQVKVYFSIKSSYIERTSLKTRNTIFEGEDTGKLSDLKELSSRIASTVSNELLDYSLPNRIPLNVTVTIDANYQITLNPKTCWASYYLFPYNSDSKLDSEIDTLTNLRMSQMVWHLESRVSSIPKNPLSKGFESTNEYLEIRHEGFKSGFIPLDKDMHATYSITLTPVLNKRIAILNFPCIETNQSLTIITQAIINAIINKLQTKPETSTYAYFSERKVDENETGNLWIKF